MCVCVCVCVQGKKKEEGGREVGHTIHRCIISGDEVHYA